MEELEKGMHKVTKTATEIKPEVIKKIKDTLVTCGVVTGLIVAAGSLVGINVLAARNSPTYIQNLEKISENHGSFTYNDDFGSLNVSEFLTNSNILTNEPFNYYDKETQPKIEEPFSDSTDIVEK